MESYNGPDHRLDEALRKSEERFHAIFSLAAVGMAQLSLDGHWQLMNRKLCEIIGYSEEELRKCTVRQICHPDDLDLHRADIHRLLTGDGANCGMERRYLQKGGAAVWVNLCVTLVRDQAGTPEYFIAIIEDISQRKRAEEALLQANEHLTRRVAERTAELSQTIDRLQDEIKQRVRIGEALQAETTERLSVQAELGEKELLLLHQSRLAAMGEMIGNIAHQWRQPLNLLGLLAQDLSMTYTSGEFSTEYLEGAVKKMLETIRHMSQTIDDFRNFFRPYKEKVDFRVLDVVQQTISLLEGSLQALRIKTEVVASGDPVLNGYPNEFSQVLLNIMINAKDALLEQNVADPTITIEIGSNGGKRFVTITDNAGGIPEAIIGRVFDPYFTTKGADRGTGLGLFMSKTIVERNMGGSLSARNLERGAQFRIEL